MIYVQTITKTCDACPAQWQGRTVNGRSVYVRYRWGHLTIELDNEDLVFEYSGGDAFDGMMSYAKLKKLTMGKIAWPKRESDEQAA